MNAPTIRHFFSINSLSIEGNTIDELIQKLSQRALSFDPAQQLKQIVDSIQALDPDMPIILEENENQRALAHLEYGRHHHTPYHKIVYKRSFAYWQHALVHELMHLEMYIRASQCGKGVVFKKQRDNEQFFNDSFGTAFQKLVPKYGAEAVAELKQITQDGLITQLLSTPLDLFVEQHIHDRYPDLAPLQLLSMLNQTKTNVELYKLELTQMLPHRIVDTSKILCLVNSIWMEEVKYGESEDEICGILFDGAWLWEEYVNTILCGLGFNHPKNKLHTGRIYLFEDNSGVRYPDFWKNDFVLDAKYKRIGSYDDVAKVDRNDIHQMIAYINALSATKGGFVTPLEDSQLTIPSKRLMGNAATLSIFGIEICKSASSYADFCEKMKILENIFVESINIQS